MSKQNSSQTYFPFYAEPQGSVLYFEDQARSRGHTLIAGVDEAGRGPLAGPLVVAACILPKGLLIEGVDDSKKLTVPQRQALYHQIVSHPKIVYAIDVIEPSQIDEINIFQATLLGMKRAVENLTRVPDFILVDGSHTPFPISKSLAIIKGDHLSHSIACASIIAKVSRDVIMEGHDIQWPEYGFARHKGYPTSDHLRLLKELGPTPIHRKSFAPVRDILNHL